MARLTSANGIKESGWVFLVGAEKDDLSDFTEVELGAMRKGAPANMNRALDLYVTEVRKTLGRVLRAPSKLFAWLTGRHFASAPGEPPAKISGDLQESWKKGPVRWSSGRLVLTGYIQSDHPAAGRLEYGDPGAKGGDGIEARPYVRVALARIAGRLHDLVLGL